MATRTVTKQIHVPTAVSNESEEGGGKRLCLEVYPMGSDEPIQCDLIPVTNSVAGGASSSSTTLRFHMEPVVLGSSVSSTAATPAPFSTQHLWTLLSAHNFEVACTWLQEVCCLQERADGVVKCLLDQGGCSNTLQVFFAFLQHLLQLQTGSQQQPLTEDCYFTQMKYDLLLPLLNATAARMHVELEVSPGVEEMEVNEGGGTFTWSDFLQGLIDMFHKTFDKTDMEEVNLSLMDCIYVLLQKSAIKESRILNILLNLLQVSVLAPSGYIHLQAKALDLLSVVGQPSTTLPRSGQTLCDVMTWFAEDNDARIRERALLALLQWQRRSFPLPRSLYQVASKALKDQEERVREAAIQLLCGVVLRFPDEKVLPESAARDHNSDPKKPQISPQTEQESEEIRLADAGFAQLCGLMQDACARVRTLTAKHLGIIAHLVSEHYLLQTLDKKVMTGLRVKKSQLTLGMESKLGTEWASGRQWNADAPQGDASLAAEEEITLLALGACGAIIHGLEDEFSDVRLATVEAIRRMGSASTLSMSGDVALFPLACQDFLVDMLTDDLSIVRLRSVEALRHVASEATTLRTEQLAIVLGGLREATDSMRWALHRLLEHSRLASEQGIMMLITALLVNLRKYPEDQYSVWRCAAAVGQRHPEFVYLNVSQLLQLHAYLTAPEPGRDDPHYITVLLMVLNACCPMVEKGKTSSQLSTLGAALFHMLPEPHATRNVTYLREVVPELVPPNLPDGEMTRKDPGALFSTLPESGRINDEVNNKEEVDAVEGATLKYLAACQQRFSGICENLFNAADDAVVNLPRICLLLQGLVSELRQVMRLTLPPKQVSAGQMSSLSSSALVSPTCNWQSAHARTRVLLNLYTSTLHLAQAAMGTSNALAQSHTSWTGHIRDAWSHITMLLHVFHGLQPQSVAALNRLAESLSALWWSVEGVVLSSHWLKKVAWSREFCEHDFPAGQLGIAHFQLQEPPPEVTDESVANLFFTPRDSAVEEFYEAVDEDDMDTVQASTASSTGTVLGLRSRRVQLVAGLAVSLPVRALLVADHAEQVRALQAHIQVCVESPDGRRIYWTPPAEAWTEVEKGNSGSCSYQLTTAVAFSADRWSDAAWLSVYLILTAGQRNEEDTFRQSVAEEEQRLRQSCLRLTPTARIQVSVLTPKHTS